MSGIETIRTTYWINLGATAIVDISIDMRK